MCAFLYKFRLKTAFANLKRITDAFDIMDLTKTVLKSPKMCSDEQHNLTNLKPPEHVAGMTDLDRSLFTKRVTVPRLLLPKTVLPSSVLPLVKKHLLKMENFKSLVHEAEQVVMYLKPGCDIGEEVLRKANLPEVDQTEITLTYDNFSADSIFKAVLPADKEGMASFTKVGHIVHVNLREHLLDFKDLIGQVLLDKVHGCESVVNKTDMIDNTYRNFQMEVLRGSDNMMATVRENKCEFTFDFSKVYWNSRLGTEHERIVNTLRPDDVLFDCFAGVGPFAVPAAKKNCLVYANDLNPESFKWLNHNSKTNKTSSMITCNKDARDFILEDFKLHFPKHLHRNVYVTMNLPAMAVEFLQHFCGLYEDGEIGTIEKPAKIFVYCFVKGEDLMQQAFDLVAGHLGNGVDAAQKIEGVFKVRTVSSNKEMMRVTVKLDRDVLVAEMGKNKKKTNNVFKVTGAKSLKLKAKAKAVKSDLKHINAKNKEAIAHLDKILMDVRDTKPPPKKTPPPRSELPSVDHKQAEEAKRQLEVTAEVLEAMQLL